jgi:hypothetical protein
MSMKHLAGCVVVSISMSLLASSPSLAKSKKEQLYTYAIPFTCGSSDGSAGGVVAGDYDTAVTVTNLGGSAIRARASIQLTEPSSEQSDRIRRAVPAGRSFLIDCDRILGGAFIQPVSVVLGELQQGVLTIDSLGSLNVVVQSSTSGVEGGVSVQTRQVFARVIKRRRTDEGETVEICHIPPGNSRERDTIEVDAPSVPAHLRHGDHLGECEDDDN